MMCRLEWKVKGILAEKIMHSLFRYPVSNIGTHLFLLTEQVDFATP